MSNKVLLAVLVMVVAGFTARSQADFMNGNLVVVRVNGTAGSAQAGFLEEYTPGGSLVQSLNLPTADGAGGNQTCTLAANTNTLEGNIARSTNGRYLTLACNDMPIGTTVASSTLDRIVARVDVQTGNIDTTTRIAYGASGWNARSAVMDGDNIWVTGSSNTRGVSYVQFGTSSAQVISGMLAGSKVAKIYNGQLYNSIDTNTSSPQGVFTIGAGLPTLPGQTATILPGFPTNTNNMFDITDYWFADPSTIYLADLRLLNAAIPGTGLQKWSLVGGTWIQQYSRSDGLASASGLRSLTGVVDGNGLTTIYATTTDNKIVAIADPDATGSSFSTIVTGSAGNTFTGIVRVPEPATLLLLVLGGLTARRRQ